MSCKVTKWIAACICTLVMQASYAQVPEEEMDPGIFTLDSFVLADVALGFDVGDCIRLVQEDSSFYRSFQNLRRIEYAGSATVRMFTEDHLVQALYSNRTIQHLSGGCRSMEFPFEVSTGDFFDKKGDFNYLTAGVFAYIFLYRDTICGNIVETDNNAGADKQLELRKEQLKTLIFNPGAPVDGVPLIGDKMEIFSADMQPFYDYSIRTERYATGVDCYVFTVDKNQSAEKGKDVVINHLSTWFDKKTMEIVARQYALSYFTPVFDFDVSMDVRLDVINGYRVPVSITYNGFWDIPLRGPEIGSVQLKVFER